MMLIVRYTYAGNRERVYADVTKNSENEKAQVYSLYTDRLGSTRWALDENAEVAAKTEYDAWGKPETETVKHHHRLARVLQQRILGREG